MNKKYIAPQIRLVNVASEGLVASSGDTSSSIGYSLTSNGDTNQEVLSNRRGGSMWEE